eukprot:126263_1
MSYQNVLVSRNTIQWCATKLFSKMINDWQQMLLIECVGPHHHCHSENNPSSFTKIRAVSVHPDLSIVNCNIFDLVVEVTGDPFCDESANVTLNVSMFMCVVSSVLVSKTCEIQHYCLKCRPFGRNLVAIDCYSILQSMLKI